MKKSKVKSIKPVKGWGIVFLHRLGWTLLEISVDKTTLKGSLLYWRTKLASYKYKIVPIKISPLKARKEIKKHLKR